MQKDCKETKKRTLVTAGYDFNGHSFICPLRRICAPPSQPYIRFRSPVPVPRAQPPRLFAMTPGHLRLISANSHAILPMQQMSGPCVNSTGTSQYSTQARNLDSARDAVGEHLPAPMLYRAEPACFAHGRPIAQMCVTVRKIVSSASATSMHTRAAKACVQHSLVHMILHRECPRSLGYRCLMPTPPGRGILGQTLAHIIGDFRWRKSMRSQISCCETSG